MQHTFALIKPDAVQRNLIGAIINMIEKNDFYISAMKMLQMNRQQAEGFYSVHRERPFFNELVDYMISGPIVSLILTGENAVTRYRELMGATNPQNAQEGTIRKSFAISLMENAVHGSDSDENAIIEINYFFNAFERIR
ncbi:nucleoside-diphosphate kinase [Lawsonia intracellularis]|uniref:Nucleoside diphosphate kinase n=1 Tax=Lawsonia intracellularis (strain PHE/MN1-00) TaxID=363253 RepID=NDK_LAWIP|nr:nucleoside-diphosphate kinase [Lawsonia intracellularis]Q1MPA2.1 RecName: Full=Nucleoside diphosphate kinase; Short=NDK; Short=NDP kinase; AltName: Full=Nucleoside-2-P kinase [Lawsonia intracellularis PHE/MN1-00]AGC50558.1 nucleoside-diphosphate kinase [Lawsonia intracellularis N343]KAA0204574.1 nucleoside-diphosphate kinase [Lawsonia intracellularis]MBZ3893009.1 nucleoside-diphosphate kinase [Lawsonia intracellularis]OMQ02362.1 nucleoside-diphosphate kinase [Lawsonia intracellularis]RBN32